MKLKNHWLLFGAILVFVVLVICISGQTQPPDPEKEAILKLIPDEWKAKNLKAMESLADKIIADNKDLSQFFGDKHYDDMVARYAQMSGAIKVQENNVVSSRDRRKFKNFWSGAREKGPKLEFRIISISLMEVPDQSVMVFDGSTSTKPINYLAYVVHEFSYGPNKAPGSAYDPTDGREYCHQTECPWGRKG